MSLIDKIHKSRTKLNKSLRLRKCMNGNYNFPHEIKPLQTPEELIQNILRNDKRLNKLKTENGKKNAFFNLITNHDIDYQVFQGLCAFFKYDYNLIDFISFKKAKSFLFCLNDIEDEEASVFLKDREVIRGRYDYLVFKRQYDEAALMLHQDFIDHFFSLFKKKDKKSFYKITPFIDQDSTYDYLKDIIPESKLKRFFEKSIQSYCDDIDSDPRNELGCSKEEFYKLKMISFNGDNFKKPKKINSELFVRNLNAKIENSLINTHKTRQNYKLRILFRSISQENDKYIYDHVLIIDNVDNVIASAEKLILDDDIKLFFAKSIDVKTSYNIKNIDTSNTKDIYQISVELEDKEEIKSLNKIRTLFHKDASLMISHLKLELSYSSDEVMISFFCARWAEKNNREEYAAMLAKSFNMLGTLKYIDYEEGSMPSYERYFFRLNIDKQKIDKYLEHYEPIEKLKTDTLYQVTEDSLKLTKGTTFYFKKYHDIWRQIIFIKKGGIILENGEVVECINKEHILFNFFASSFSAQTNLIPKCKII